MKLKSIRQNRTPYRNRPLSGFAGHLKDVRKFPESLDAFATHIRYRKLRVMVAGPPKTGNVWIKHILAAVYGLDILREVPDFQPQDLTRFVDEGKFRPGTIFHQHYWPDEAFFDALSNAECHIVSTIRNPYDVFVSLFFYAQHQPDQFIRNNDAGAVLIGKDITHPDVLRYLEDSYGGHMQLAYAWLQCSKGIVARYESLYSDPIPEVRRITDRIHPVSMRAIVDAVETSRADVLRQRSEDYRRHIRAATVGDWRNHLTQEHLAIFHDRYSNLIQALGYDIVDPGASRDVPMGDGG